MSRRSVLVDCIDGQGHVWGPSRILVDGLSKTWEAASCTKCNTGSLTLSDDPPASIASFLDLLANAEDQL